MKKLIVIAAVACIASAANAANYKWTATIGGVETIYEATPSFTSENVYYFLCANGDDATVASKNALLSALREAGGGYDTILTGTTGFLTKGPMTSDGNYSDNLLENFSGGATMGGYGVIIDTDAAGNTWAYFATGNSGTGVIESGTGTGMLALDGSSDYTITQGIDATIGDNYDTWIQVSSVPEPTSGLLLLLGVAGLALRRRRA